MSNTTEDWQPFAANTLIYETLIKYAKSNFITAGYLINFDEVTLKLKVILISIGFVETPYHPSKK